MTHIPVMPVEVLQFLRPEQGGLFVDCTVGLGGHSRALLEAGASRVIGLDRDLDALARALRLDKAEAAHLRALARRDASRAFVPERVPPSIARLVVNLNQPAYVTGRRWDILVWNAAAADLLGFDRLAQADRNILVYMFVEPHARELFAASWSDEARRMIALFRASHDLHASDPAFIALVARLRTSSSEFAQWWDAHDVRSGVSGQKVFAHARQGVQRYEYATFQANDDPALKLAIYTPVSGDDGE